MEPELSNLRSCRLKRKDQLMDNAIIELANDSPFVDDITDRALETAAGSADSLAANYTLAACSGLSVCPQQ